MQKTIKSMGSIFIVLSLIGAAYIGFKISWPIGISSGFIAALQGVLVLAIGEILESLEYSNNCLFKINNTNKHLDEQNELLKKQNEILLSQLHEMKQPRA